MNRRLALSVILIVALLARLGAIGVTGASAMHFGDGPDYVAAASDLCTSGSYPERSSLPFFRAPGFPAFIAAATLCHSNSVPPVKVSLAMVDTLSVALVYLLAAELFHDAAVSLLAAAAAAVHPFFIAQVCDVQSEALFMCLFLASVWLTLNGARRRRFHLALLSGLCAGAAALVRPAGLVLLLWLPDRHRPRPLAAFLAGAILCLGPWTIRNALRYHELIPVNDAGGYNFWRGTSPELASVEELSDPQAFAAASIRFETVVSPAIAREIEKDATTPMTGSRLWYRLALHNLIRSPRAFTLRLLRNAWTYWRPWLAPQTHSHEVVAASGIMMSLLSLAAFAGWIVLRRQNRSLALWCAAGALAFWILQIPFQVVSRFRIPIADPFLIIFAAGRLTSVARTRNMASCDMTQDDTTNHASLRRP